MVEKSESPRKKELVIGLTGGLASGKTTVSRLFAAHGFAVIDADQIARQVSMNGGRAHDALVRDFGTSDRGELAKIVFSDPSKRKKLEAILHPAIRDESDAQIREALARAHASAKPAIVIYDAALLIETGRAKDFDALVCVIAGRENQKARAVARDSHRPENEIDAILSAQTTDEIRKAHATHVLENTGSIDDLRHATLALARQFESRVSI